MMIKWRKFRDLKRLPAKLKVKLQKYKPPLLRLNLKYKSKSKKLQHNRNQLEIWLSLTRFLKKLSKKK